MELSSMATRLLDRLQQSPERLRYDTGVLGGMFRPGDLEILDSAYEELLTAGLIERSPGFVSFFGTPKRLFRLTEKGRLVEMHS
jgi:hypothetical protein